MNGKNPSIVRVFSNNAVLASLDGTEQVIVGRGVGFGHRPGDEIEQGSHRYYVEANSDQLGFLQTLKKLPTRTHEVLSQALDLASEILGDLHPSIYVVLIDHLVFAMQRLNEGQVIRNTLSEEIEAVFPLEYAAAEALLSYINSNLETELPSDEATFIALHLNAARSGVPVKQPLEQANALAEIVEKIGTELGVPKEPPADLIKAIYGIRERVRNEAYRKNDAARSIYRDLPLEVDVAARIIRDLAGVSLIPREAEGEVAYLALHLHAWRQAH